MTLPLVNRQHSRSDKHAVNPEILIHSRQFFSFGKKINDTLGVLNAVVVRQVTDEITEKSGDVSLLIFKYPTSCDDPHSVAVDQSSSN